MNQTDLEIFDATLQKTSEWLRETMEELGSDDRHLAYLALRTVLHTLRDRLPVNEAVDLGAQLPMLVRGFYYEGWSPSGKPVKLHREDFLDAIRDHFPHPTRPNPAFVARAVFRVLAAHVTGGEIEDVKRVLPDDFRDLWEGR